LVTRRTPCKNKNKKMINIKLCAIMKIVQDEKKPLVVKLQWKKHTIYFITIIETIGVM
jgi:hypothetical protein